MSEESNLVNLVKHLQATYNTLNHYTKDREKLGVEWCNLEYTKKFIYEKLEATVRQLNHVRTMKSDSTPLISSIMGGMKESPKPPAV